MGIELILARFDDESDETEDPEVLQRLADAVRRILPESKRADVDVDASAQQVLVDLPGGTAEIKTRYAWFPIVDLDSLTLRVIFELAKAADMVVLADGADYSAIVVDPSQRNRLPEGEEWKSEGATPLCRSPEELGRLLQGWYRGQAEYRERAVADWTARSQSSHPVVRRSDRPAARPSPYTGQPVEDWTARRQSNDPVVRLSDLSGVTGEYRWDPWVNDVVLNGPKPELVRFHRFDHTASQVPKHPDVLRELREVCERHVQEKKEPSSRLIDDEEWPPLDLRMRFYTAKAWPDRLEFNLYELSDSVAALMFEIACTGDMSLILPGGVVLTDPGQAARVPQTWQETKTIVSCHSATELKYWVRNLQLDLPREDWGYGFNMEEPVPGTCPAKPRTVYIEAKPKESAVKHQKKVYKHKPQSPDGPRRPARGLLAAEFWQLDTPSGRRFYAYGYGGEGWLDYLRDFASSEQRMLGSIVNFETFVQDDGQRFAVSACKVGKVEL